MVCKHPPDVSPARQRTGGVGTCIGTVEFVRSATGFSGTWGTPISNGSETNCKTKSQSVFSIQVLIAASVETLVVGCDMKKGTIQIKIQVVEEKKVVEKDINAARPMASACKL
jgi:hypothetical protein